MATGKGVLSNFTVNIYLVSIRWRRATAFLQRLANAHVPDGWNIEFKYVPCVDASKYPNLPGKTYSDWVVSEGPEHLLQWWGREVTRGEQGCLLSHLRAIHAVAKSTADLNIIFEDDASISSDLFLHIKDIILGLPDDWDCFYLGRNKVYGTTKEESVGSVLRASYSYQTHAIAWTAKAATKVVDNIDIIMENQIPSDELLPTLFGVHPREDLNQLFLLRLNGYATKEKMSKQINDSINDTF